MSLSAATVFTPHPDALPMAPFPIQLTPKASEMAQRAMQEEQLEGFYLRIGVVGGGCSGLQYLLDFTETPHSYDLVSSFFGVQVCIDPFSAMHLAGTTIDYLDDLQHSGFKFDNPNVVRQCGCGSSFQT